MKVYTRHISFLLSIAILLGFLGCTTTIQKTIVSDPAGADIYIGSTKESLQKKTKTPYTESHTDTNPIWEREYYQVKKAGYADSEIILKPRTTQDRYIQFSLKSTVDILEPLGQTKDTDSGPQNTKIISHPAPLVLLESQSIKEKRPFIRKDQNRIALVIGNSRYQDSPLKNPVNDAKAIVEVLKTVGFDVESVSDANYKRMLGAIRRFGKKLQAGGTGLFYFAGHGLQLGDQNYLIPIGAKIESEADVAFESVPLGRVLSEMGTARNGANIVILDACRNNPYNGGFRSLSRGLTRVDGPEGTIIAYATSPGSVASDGDGKHGLYTTHLLNAMKQPGRPIEFVFKDVAARVKRDSNGKQVPWYSAGSFTGEFSFISSKTNTKIIVE